MKVEMVDATSLVVPDWNATYILRPDLIVLARSIGTHGFTSPLVVQKDTNVVIDGTQRLRLVLGNKHLLEQCDGVVPVNYVDCDDVDAMVMHVQLNRGRGQMYAKRLSSIVNYLRGAIKFSDQEFMDEFNMRDEELELMLNPSIIKHRDIKNHSYSRAWVPVEAPPGTVESAKQAIEAPPNADR